MPTHTNNRIVFDINKVTYAWLYWRNQHGETLRYKPTIHTAHCVELPIAIYAYPALNEYPCETAFERAKHLGILDVWQPVIKLRMSAADVLEFSGDKAMSIWRTWNSMQFKNTRKNERPKQTTTT